MYYSTMYLYGLGVCRSWWGLCQVHSLCQQGAPHPSSATSLQKGPYSNNLTLLPCQCATLMLGSCSPCSDLRRDTENYTLSFFPEPLVLVGSTGSSCSHGCREGSVGGESHGLPLSLSIRATGTAVLCQAAVTPGKGWWPWELTGGVTCPELPLLPRLLRGHRTLCHWNC